MSWQITKTIVWPFPTFLAFAAILLRDNGGGGCCRSSLSAMFSCIVTTRLYGELQRRNNMSQKVFCNLSSQWRHSVDIIYHLSVSDSWHGELLEAQFYLQQLWPNVSKNVIFISRTYQPNTDMSLCLDNYVGMLKALYR